MPTTRKRTALGRGVDAVFGGTSKNSNAISRSTIPLAKIRPRANQPRQRFDETALRNLANSIKRHGLLQPIVVRPIGDNFEIIAGERRYRACKLAGLIEVDAFIRVTEDASVVELALVENLQRENLSPIEESRAFATFIDSLNLTQAQAAERLGLNRTTVTNKLRLLTLPASVQILVDTGRISEGHGRALLGITDYEASEMLATQIVDEGLSVRAVEQMVRSARNKADSGLSDSATKPVFAVPPSLHTLQKALESELGSRVRIVAGGDPTDWKGRIVISYYSQEELEHLGARILNKEIR